METAYYVFKNIRAVLYVSFNRLTLHRGNAYPRNQRLLNEKPNARGEISPF